MYCVYFIKSVRNNKTYVGYTEKTPGERLKEHNAGANKWTKDNRPFRLIYYETYHCKIDARKRELFYKTGFGKAIKKVLVNYLENIVWSKNGM